MKMSHKIEVVKKSPTTTPLGYILQDGSKILVVNTFKNKYHFRIFSDGSMGESYLEDFEHEIVENLYFGDQIVITLGE